MFQSEIKSKKDEDISILVKPDNHSYNYICECGDASKLTVKEIQNAQAIFISHTHIDHFINFDSMVRHQIGVQRRIVIVGPKGMAKQVQSRILGYTWNLIEQQAITYEIRELVSDNEVIHYEIQPPIWELKEIGKSQGNVLFKEKGFQVTGVLLDHKIPTVAYKFQEEDTLKITLNAEEFKGGRWVQTLKNAFANQEDVLEIEVNGKLYQAKELYHLLHIQKGDTLGIIMDHAAHAENHSKIKAHFKGCRRVYIESFYKQEDKALAEINFHSYTEQSAKIIKEAEVVEPIPVHFSRKYSSEEVEQLIEEFNQVLNG